MIGIARLRGGTMVVGLALVLAACGSGSPGGTPAPQASGSPADQGGGNAGAGNSGGGGQVVFNVTVAFTGDYSISGSFVDGDTGSGYTSCAQYATLNPTVVGSWLSPGPPAGADTQLGGKSLNFAFQVSTTTFHGPATYAGSLPNVTIGADTFIAGNKGTSTMTLNADGSGQGTFATFENIGAGSGTESGTISWTCSG